MKIDLTKTRLQILLKITLFAAAALIIFQLFPRHNSLKYQYELGKPWSYELITAPFDFPIYKDKTTLKAEQIEALKAFLPYYMVKKDVAEKQLRALHADAKIPPAYKRYIAAQLADAYARGVISSADLDTLRRNDYRHVFLVDSAKYSNRTAVVGFYTTKTAYEAIIANRPAWTDESVLRSFNINFLLKENLQYNRKLSEENRENLLKQVFLTSGMVQAGERIVDKGEIVTKNTEQLLQSLSKELDKESGAATQHNFMRIGEALLIFALMLFLYLYFMLFRPLIFQNIKHLSFILLMVLLVSGTSYILLNLRTSSFAIYLIPFAILPIIIRTFFDSRTAFAVHTITILLVALVVPNAFEFVLLQLTAGLTSILILKDLTQRSQLIKTALFILLNYVFIYLGYSLLIKGTLTELDLKHFSYFGVNALLLLFAYVLIYIFERIFGFISNVTLVELSNVNSPLLQMYSETAPGTFQHSLQVANLASEAAKKINGNALLVRIGALYHDIGKMSHPLYFSENQLSGVNPLKDKNLEEAAQCIIGHVAEGVKIAERHNIPEKIIDFIRTHHGDGRAWYFYNSFRNQFPDQPVNEDAFCYHCPPPATKEQAILMMADAVEASSRSLNEYSDESINTLVDSIINKQIADGLLKHAKITFMDVEKVKTLFKEKLKTIYHTRVSYPELKR